jgi:arginyl-tRNA synthetase
LRVSRYDSCHILSESNEELRNARLKFIEAVGEVIKDGLGLLGIKTLDRM